jgi:hypothetical protein
MQNTLGLIKNHTFGPGNPSKVAKGVMLLPNEFLIREGA